jgi:rhodanese-related sulfurtransferase
MARSWGVASLAVLMMAAAFVGTARADHEPAVKLIDATRIKSWIDQGKKVTIVDSRVRSEFTEGHLPTAINIPSTQMDQMKDRLPKDKAHAVIFYCNGWPECTKSHEACSKAVRWGYKDVYWFKDGVPGWQAKRYPLQ